MVTSLVVGLTACITCKPERSTSNIKAILKRVFTQQAYRDSAREYQTGTLGLYAMLL